MNTRQSRIILAGFIAASVTAFSQTANAQGLFGNGGVFRGDVGNWIDRNVEKPYLTPLARETVVGGTTAVGSAVGGYVGGPTGARVGGYVGGYVGNQINERAAGQSPPIGRPARYPQAQPQQQTPHPAGMGRTGLSGGYHQGQSAFAYQAPAPVAHHPPPPMLPPTVSHQPTVYPVRPAVQFGTVCATPNGLTGHGAIRPLGAFCQIATPYGVFAGQIIQ
jgi:hypothetical protein